MYIKTCSKCFEEKNITEFHKNKCNKDGLQSYCKQCRKNDNNAKYENIKRYSKQYYVEHRDDIKRYNKKYRAEHKDELKRNRIKYRINNKDRINETKRKYAKKCYHSDKNYRVNQLLRGRLRSAIVKEKASLTTLELLQCSIKTVIKWLEFTFDENMSWENQGKYWDIDHIRPIASFDYLADSEKQQKRCFVWWNLQALEHIENCTKNAKRDKDLELRMKEKAKDFRDYRRVKKYFKFLNDY